MSVNKVILIGNAGKDPEVRYLDSGVAVASFPLATTERGYTLQNGTQVPERTDWHNIVLWRGLAEIAEKYVHKGDKLYIEGKIRTRSYADQTGAQRYVTEIFAESMEMLSPRAQSSSAGTSAPVNPTSQASPSSSSSTPGQAGSYTPPSGMGTASGVNDDLPF